MNYYIETELVAKTTFMELHLKAIEENISELVELQKINTAILEKLVKALSKEET